MPRHTESGFMEFHPPRSVIQRYRFLTYLHLPEHCHNIVLRCMVKHLGEKSFMLNEFLHACTKILDAPLITIHLHESEYGICHSTIVGMHLRSYYW